jgi:hypothetical protein
MNRMSIPEPKVEHHEGLRLAFWTGMTVLTGFKKRGDCPHVF